MNFDTYAQNSVTSLSGISDEAATPTLELKSSSAILARQNQRESNARTYARRLALALQSAEGAYVKDVDGRSYIDCLAGAGTLALGHNHPEVIAALREALEANLPLHTLDLTTPVKDQFVEELFQSLPASMRDNPRGWKIQFCSPSGADAVEAALKLAKIATRREAVIAFHGGYHGMTHGALSLMGNLSAKSHVTGLMPNVHFMPYPYAYRCPFGMGDTQGVIAARYFEHVLKDPEGGITLPAGVILEVVQGEGGVIPAPVHWLREVRRVTKELGIPLILDEVQTGIGRTGHMFAFERAGVEPDILVLSKAIGGSLPLAVLIYRAELDLWAPGAHAGTFRGNQLAMAGGRVTLRKVREPAFLAQVERRGQFLANSFRAEQTQRPYFGDIRQAGLMLGIEIVNPHAAPDRLGALPHWPEMAALIRSEALARGLILELGGRHSSVIRLLPPLIIDDETCSAVIERLLDASAKAWQSLKGDRI